MAASLRRLSSVREERAEPVMRLRPLKKDSIYRRLRCRLERLTKWTLASNVAAGAELLQSGVVRQLALHPQGPTSSPAPRSAPLLYLWGIEVRSRHIRPSGEQFLHTEGADAPVAERDLGIAIVPVS